MRHYCTYFDMNYLVKGMALLRSLEKHSTTPYRIHVVCLDELTRVLLSKMAPANVELWPLHIIEEKDEALAHARSTRARVEYYWTLTPSIICRILEQRPEIDRLTYMDADLYFYSPPEAMDKEIGKGSILIHGHRFTPSLRTLARNGIYNVGLLSFRRDTHGMAALTWWRDRCNEWCFDKYEDGKMGDQKYLDDWPTRFQGVVVLENIGAGLGPWNHDQYSYQEGKSGAPLVNKTPVVFYHFHSLEIVSPSVFVPSKHSHYPFTEQVLRCCYRPYCIELKNIMQDLGELQPSLKCGLTNTIFNNMLFIAKQNVRKDLAQFFATHDLLPFGPEWDCFIPRERIQHIELSPGTVPQPLNNVQDAVKAFDSEKDSLIKSLQSIGLKANPKYEELEKQAYDYLDEHMYDKDVLPRLIAMQEKMYRTWLSKSLCEDGTYQKRPYALSAIVSTYKSGDFMAECLEDLTRQTIGEALEIIIVDAASPENERAVVADFQKRFSNIRYVRLPERIGIYPAWNVGIYHSCGECLTPFSTNDRLRPDAYEMMLRHLKNNPGATLVYGNTHLTSEPHQTYQKYTPMRGNSDFLWPPFNYYQLLFNCLVGPHPVWRRFVHKEVGYFDPRYSAIADQDFWLRIGKFHTLQHIPEFTGLQWLSDDSLSCRATGQMEIFDIQRKHQKDWLKERNAQYTTVEMGAMLTLFMLILTRLIESKNLPQVLSFWENHHGMFPAVPQITQIGELVDKVRRMTGAPKTRN